MATRSESLNESQTGALTTGPMVRVLSLVSIVLVVFSLCGAVTPTWASEGGAAAPTPSTTAIPVHGELDEIAGLKVLYVAGTNEEQGFAEGYLCARQIQELFLGFALRNALVRSPVMWDTIVVPLVKKRVDAPAPLRERLEAVLRGMRERDRGSLYLKPLKRDLTVDDLIAAAALPDWIGLMCSSFASWDRDAELESDADTITRVGRNLDYFGTDALTENLMLVVRAPTEGRHGWLSFGYPGLGGCITGISDQGVLVAVHDVLSMNRDRGTMTPRLMALEELIAHHDPKQHSAEDAAKYLRKFRYGMGGNVLLTWSRGASVLELDGRKTLDQGVTVREPAEGESCLACSNDFRARGRFRRECPRYNAIWDMMRVDSPDDLAESWAVTRSASKSDTLYRLVAELETGVVVLERRRTPGGEWYRPVKFNARPLLERAAALSPSPTEGAPTPPAPPSGKPKKKKGRVVL